MTPKQIKLVIWALIGMGLFAVAVNWGCKVYTQKELARIQKEEAATFREQLLYKRLREIDQKFIELDWKIMTGQPLPQRNPPVNVPPQQPQSFGDETRHYFQNSNAENFAQIKSGMTQDQIRSLCAGQEYPPFETVRNGFCFALNDDRNLGFYCFKDWMPVTGLKYDFFVSANGGFLYVRYDGQGMAETVSQFPLDNGQTVSQNAVGVKTTQDENTMRIEISPSF